MQIQGNWNTSTTMMNTRDGCSRDVPPLFRGQCVRVLDKERTWHTGTIVEDCSDIRTGQVKKSSPKKPRSRNIFKALFCCLHAHDAAQTPLPSHDALLHTEENGSITKVCESSLLPDVTLEDEGKICVVIDLDETLVHSSFKPISNADFIVPVEIEGTTHQVYVLKRPHVDKFLQRMGEMFECVLFTASLAKYADPVTDLLDQCGVFRARLFRESCVFHHGCYVKDLSRLGRQLNKTLILDNSPASYIFHPENAVVYYFKPSVTWRLRQIAEEKVRYERDGGVDVALISLTLVFQVPVLSWFDDVEDTELLNLLPVFEELSGADDVYAKLRQLREP
ncbi:hypothetical protein QTP86_012526 [Hemibagrus guttatus]|nr:hypothetical protein QTP86_012526 [Hemibagrus guttatus]